MKFKVLKLIVRSALIFLMVTGCASQQEETDLEKRAKAYYNHGTNELYEKNYTVALQNLLEAHKLSPKDTKTLNNLGMAFYFKGESTEALKYLTKTLELDPNFNEAKLNIATIYMSENKDDQALKMFKEITRDLLYPEQFKTYYNMGLIYKKRGDSDKALNNFKKSAEQFENFCPAFLEMGKINFQRKQWKDAYRDFYKSSLGKCYNKPEPHYYQSLTLIEMGKYYDAYEKLDHLISRFKESDYTTMAQRKLMSITPFISNEKLNEYSLKKELETKREKKL